MRRRRETGVGIALGLSLLAGAPACYITRAPVARQTTPTIVDDVSQINPIAVSEVITPTTTREIVDAVRRHPGPIAIGGSRHSMGGQIATAGALHMDMRRFDRVLAFDPVRRRITVQAGIRWRQVQEHIDPANLSVKIMQSYANFTVGGSLSVNAHGRYVGLGPLVGSVRSVKLVLADGAVVEASRDRNSDIFFGAIGGYGGLGVITEATLDLVENSRVKRLQVTMPVNAYRQYFFRNVRGSTAVVFHNADIYPDAYGTVRATSYVRTDEPVTVPDRLTPTGKSYGLNRFAGWVVSEWPLGKEIRQHIIDPWRFRGALVVWRNYEASQDAAELEPASRTRFTYVLQEYFVPVEQFDDFVSAMRGIFRRHGVNIINVSIRHAMPDPGTLLAWAPREVFAFVVYYKQGTDTASRRAVGVWTRELIDAALRVGGSYYLPYQLHATESQFLRAYPGAPEFFTLKKRLDPTNKFRNMLWDKYYSPR
jgi:FAD/FMN-containing dehydrogenase